VCCLSSDGQFLVNSIQKHCQAHYQDGGGSVDSIIAEEHGVCGDLNACNNIRCNMCYPCLTTRLQALLGEGI